MSLLQFGHPRGGPSLRHALPILGFVGASGAGKTTLITAVIPYLSQRGLRVGVIKHARHGFDMDRPGKDSYRIRSAGAAQVLVASRDRWVLMTETPAHASDPDLRELVQQFDHGALDLILVEGFAGASYPKIEVHRPAQGEPPRCWPGDPDVIAVASDAPLAVVPPVALLDLNDPAAVAGLILDRLLPARPAAHVQ